MYTRDPERALFRYIGLRTFLIHNIFFYDLEEKLFKGHIMMQVGCCAAFDRLKLKYLESHNFRHPGETDLKDLSRFEICSRRFVAI